MDAQASTQTNRCLQQYLSICSEEEYCRDLEEDVTCEHMVVVHVRYGDIFPPNFSSKDVLPEYGQPPPPIFDFVRPKRVIIVGEPSFEGPVWKKNKKVPQKHKALRNNVEFRSEQYRDDLVRMICAKADRRWFLWSGWGLRAEYLLWSSVPTNYVCVAEKNFQLRCE